MYICTDFFQYNKPIRKKMKGKNQFPKVNTKLYYKITYIEYMIVALCVLK